MVLASAGSASSSTPIFILPNGTIIVELVIFVIVLGIVAKFILPPLQAALDEREARVRGALEVSDEGKAAAAQLVAERAQVLDAARAEARALLEDAGRRAEATRAEARARAEVEYGRRIEEAAQRIDAQARRAREELAGSLGSVVIAAAERLIGATLDPERHREVIDEATEALRTRAGSVAS